MNLIRIEPLISLVSTVSIYSSPISKLVIKCKCIFYSARNVILNLIFKDYLLLFELCL